MGKGINKNLKTARSVAAKPDQALAKLPEQRDPECIFTNDRGQLAMTTAGSLRATRTFLGLNAAADQNNTLLDNVRLGQTAGALPYSRGQCGAVEALNIALESVAALAPRDGMEVMLCSQLVALHSQGMEFLRRGLLPEQTNEAVDSSVNRATKLFRTYATIADCLRTYRGGGQQKVTVEHVTVQAGGQAIVGTVNKGPGGGDDR